VFERFTERARRVVVLAQEEARRLDHNFIGTEHILLGLLHEGEGVAAVSLEALGISLDAVRRQVEATIGRGEAPPTDHIPFTPRAKNVLELSLREALQLKHNYIGTEHILLGLIREGEGVGAQVLEKLGAEPDLVREQVTRLISGFSEGGVAEAGTPGRRQREKTDPPSCPRCRRSLAETATYRVLEIPDAEREGETTSFTFLFCRNCGTSLGTIL
jgi:ATP-dependent Clp protease ATP-binding subunit ClpC